MLIQNKYKASYLFGTLASIYFLLDFVTYEKMMSSYINISLLTLILLVIVSKALEKTVLLDYFSKIVIKKNYNMTFLNLGILTTISSAFLNNTAIVAGLMNTIKNNKYHLPSKLLIPLSYFSIIGGTMTLIGTSTNLLVNGFLTDMGNESLKMFDFFIVGFFITLFCSIALFLVKGLLPEYKVQSSEIEKHLIELQVSHNSSMIGKSVKENGLRSLEYLFLVEISRNDRIISPIKPDEIILANDKLVFSGDLKHINVLDKFSGLTMIDNIHVKQLTLVDSIIMPDSTIIGEKVKESKFRSKFDASIISMKRGSQDIKKIGDEIIQSGDRLILAIGQDFYNRDNISKNFYLLSDIKQKEKFNITKSGFIFGGFLLSLVLAALGFISLFKSIFIYCFILIVLKVINIQEIRRVFPYELFITIGSSLVISKVLISSGIADNMANFVTSIFGSYGAYGSFIGIYLLTLFLTEIITNNAAAALSFPIAYATANGLDVSVLPFVFAVAFGASASFIMPYGYQTNLMVNSIGGYKIKDFMKIGWIITVVYSSVVIYLIPQVYSF